MMYELIDENLLLVPDCLHSFPNIREHLQRFERLPQVIIIDVLLLLLLFLLLLLLLLPQVAAYMRSPEFMKYPINNKMAACLA